MSRAKPSFRVYFVAHADGRLTGTLLRQWDALFDKPPPAAYGEDEDDVLELLEVQLLERAAEKEPLARYLWQEDYTIHRVTTEVRPQTSIKKVPVVGAKRVPLRLTYAAARTAAGVYRVLVPRFNWRLLVEDLSIAGDVLRDAVSTALLGESPRWLYDFRQEGDEYIKPWTPLFLQRSELATRGDEDDDEDDEMATVRGVADELVQRARRGRLPRLVGDDPLDEAALALVRATPPRSLMLVGEAGVGKTSWVYRLAQRIARWHKERPDDVLRIWATSADRIIAGMVYLGQWQERCFEIVSELRFEGDYLYLDRLGPILRPQVDGASIADLLLPAVTAGEISLLAECRPAELAHYRERFPAFVDQFELLHLEETPLSRVPGMLAEAQRRRRRGAEIHGQALRDIAGYLDLFAPHSSFPGKAFRFLDWLAEQPGQRGTIYPADASALFSRYSGLPVALLADDVPLTEEVVADALGQRIVGQDAACRACAGVVSRLKARINDPDKPAGTFLFVGPTGVGKTELAKQLARYLYSDERRLIRVDMSEYLSPHSAQRLLLSGPGARSLAARVLQQPLCVVLLDEIEKAHPRVFDLLLGVLGEGRLTDDDGRLVDFRMAVIVMTSNLGVSETAPVGFGDRLQDDFLQQVRGHFRPEFFNRLDEVVAFRHLDRDDVLRIVELELAKVSRRLGLVRRRLELRLSPAAAAELAEQGFHPTRGARPLKRVIEERLVSALAVELAAHPRLADQRIEVVAASETPRGPSVTLR